MNDLVERARRIAAAAYGMSPESFRKAGEPALRELVETVEQLSEERDAMQRRAETAEHDWLATSGREATLRSMLFQAEHFGTVGSATYNAVKALDLSTLYACLDAEPPIAELEFRILERAIDRMGWPEIHAFEAELHRGQSVDEDAGGFLMRAVRRLFGLPARDTVVSYQEAARALVAEHRGLEIPSERKRPQPRVTPTERD